MTRASFCFGLDLSTATIKGAPSGVSDVFQKGLFQFNSLNGFTSMRLPAISETKVVVGSDAIDTSDADVAAFITAMEDGIVVTGGTISPSDYRVGDISSLKFATPPDILTNLTINYKWRKIVTSAILRHYEYLSYNLSTEDRVDFLFLIEDIISDLYD